ncbi:hypothetical protein [Caminibacter sp.]
MIDIFHHDKFIATLQAENKRYILEYKNFDLSSSISLSLPNTQKFYITEYDFIPYFEIIGKRMLDSWQNKEITDDIIRTWRKN